MTENIRLSDTFDNLSLIERLDVGSSQGNIFTTTTESHKNIAFDDSAFLTETFFKKVEIASRLEESFSEDIFGSPEEGNSFGLSVTRESYDGCEDDIVKNDKLNNITHITQYSTSLEYEHSTPISYNSNHVSQILSQLLETEKFDECEIIQEYTAKSAITNEYSKSTQINKLNNVQNSHTEEENLHSCDIDLHCLTSWGLPENILQKYSEKKITTMFDWQVECLSNRKVIEHNSNLVYSAPTSAGKTLVAEILAIKTVLERKKKVVFILPFVSVVREKMFYFQDVLSINGIRVEGFMGSYNPPGGFKNVQVAICTIEKANNLLNRLLEDNLLADIGAVIIDEMHLLGDPHRGYLLELLLTKLLYMCKKDKDINVQIIGMSATLPNLNVLAKWLDAELYTTEFRPVPLHEMVQVDLNIFDDKMNLIRTLQNLPDLGTDTDNILQLCLETICNSCSVLIFCPTKNWCENLAQQIAVAFWKLGNSSSTYADILRQQINSNNIMELLEQLKRCPVGLDKVLEKTVSFGVSFHHAGLTMDERDIIEAAFRNGALRILVATSTLSSGVNLPAQRVIIRTPMFHGKSIDPLTYRQMIGRAGRMGKDTSGESILICQKNDYKIAKELLSAQMAPIESCLEGSGRLKRAILEVIASGVVSTPEDLNLFTNCTLLAATEYDSTPLSNPISSVVEFLQNNEFIRLQNADNGEVKYVATSLGKACLSSSLPPEEGLTLFSELDKARQCFVLEGELHLIYLVTPYSASNQWGNIDWMAYLDMWEKLPRCMKRVGELVGVRESYLVNATRSKIQSGTSKAYQKLMVHKRFYTALALQDLVNEVPLNNVAAKFNCSRGMLQSLQQSASTFAGMVTSFSRQLGWSCIEILISQFQDRLQFGVSRDLLDLMKLPLLTGYRARALYSAGIETLVDLASSDACTLENILHKALPFESEKKREDETAKDIQERNKFKTVWVYGKRGLTEREAAILLIKEARRYLELEMGLMNAEWNSGDKSLTKDNQKFDEGGSDCSSSESDDSLTDICNQSLNNKKQSLQSKSNSDRSFKLHLSSEDDDALHDQRETQNIESTTNLNDYMSGESLFEETTDDDAYAEQNLEDNMHDPYNNHGKEVKLDDDIVNSQTECEFVLQNSFSAKNLLKRTARTSISTVSSPSKRLKTGHVNSFCSETHETDKEFEIMNKKLIGCHLAENIVEMEIIDVCKYKTVFNSFCNEIQQKSVISLSIACSEFKEENVPKIGSNCFGKTPRKSVTHKKLFKYKSIKMDGFAVNWGKNTVYYVDLADDDEINVSTKVNVLKSIASDSLKSVRMFDAKEQLKSLSHCCAIDIHCFVEDPKVGDWILQPEGNEKNLQAMAVKYCPAVADLSQLSGSCKGVGSVGLNINSTLSSRLRASVESVVTWHLIDSVREALINQDLRLLDVYDTEMKTIQCLAAMEVYGFGLSKVSLEQLVDTIKQQMTALENQVYSLAGRRFSITSSTEVAKVIGIYKGKRVSTSKQVLEKNENPISDIVLQWRKLSSTLTKMMYPLLRSVENERICGSYITRTATGRITMHEPNLQNVARDFVVSNPVTNISVDISCRSAFVCAANFILLSADYCQLELRLLAHLSQDNLLLSVMKTEEDVFKSIAAKWNNVSESQVTDTLRQRAKQICYGIIYGMGSKTLSEQLGVTEAEATEFMETFHSKYPGIKKYINKIVGKCRKDEYVETISGRRRYLANINHKSTAIKHQAERQAVNTTIQGSAADIAKKAMVTVLNHFRNNYSCSDEPKLVLHLHDELLFEVPLHSLIKVAKVVKECMEHCITLSVPLPVKMKSGLSWGEMQEFIL